MRGPWLALVVVLAIARSAFAGHSIVVMSEPDRAGALGGAMQIALAGRGLAIATLPAPGGELRLERAGHAQRAALQLGAEAAVWIDEGDVCVVASDGRAFRHAPLPPDLADTPRAFAAIAASLLDELIAPPEPAQNIDVDVHVRVNGEDRAVNGFVDPRPMAPPPPMDVVAPGLVGAATEPGIPRRDRTLIAIGPQLSPVTAGLQAELSFPLSQTYRLGVNASANLGIGDPVFVWSGALELRGIVSGRRNHFDIGGTAGFATANDHSRDSTIGYAGVSLNYTWEHEGRGTMFSFVPIVITDGSLVAPGAFANLRWVFAL